MDCPYIHIKTTHSMIGIQVQIEAPIEKAWNYWTQPEYIVNWNFASDDWHCPNAENDLRPGGTFSYGMASKDGQMSFNFEGRYDDVIEHKKIAFTMADGRKVSIEFAEEDGVTTLRESFEPESLNPHEMQRDGWQAILNNFKKLVEKV